MTNIKDNPKRVVVSGRYLGGGLFTPKTNDKGDEKYSALIVLDQAENKKVDKIIHEAITEKWGSKRPARLKVCGANYGDNESYESSYGHYFINPKSSRKPKCVFKKDGVFEKIEQADGILYPGCYVYVSITSYAQDPWGERNFPVASLYLNNVLFKAHGESLSNASDPDEDFEEYEPEEELFNDPEVNEWDAA